MAILSQDVLSVSPTPSRTSTHGLVQQKMLPLRERASMVSENAQAWWVSENARVWRASVVGGRGRVTHVQFELNVSHVMLPENLDLANF